MKLFLCEMTKKIWHFRNIIVFLPQRLNDYSLITFEKPTIMKKFYIMMVMALSSLAINAQQALYLSTSKGTALDKYDGKECKVTVNRYLFHGWNTLSLPFAVSEDELNEAFGADCRLEQLVGAEEANGIVTLFFQDCKSDGIQANKPYILYYTGENASRRLAKTAVIDNSASVAWFNVKGSTDRVEMVGAQQHVNESGLYGVLAVDNADAKFVAVDESKSGFYATRCYVKLDSGADKMLRTMHLAAGDVTGISQVVASGAKVDVYTISGVKMASGLSAEQVSKLQPGIYVINGQKVAVK